MSTIAIVSPGFMGAGLGWALHDGGARVVATAAGRSERTRRLAGEAGIELLPALPDAVAVADVVLSVTPPGSAVAAARTIDVAVRAAGVRPVLADLNAVAPATMTAIARTWADLPVADGSVSGAPPTVRSGARLYLSGPAAAEVAALPWGGHVRPVVLDAGVGAASALKMCTASALVIVRSTVPVGVTRNVVLPSLQGTEWAGHPGDAGGRPARRTRRGARGPGGKRPGWFGGRPGVRPEGRTVRRRDA